MADYDRDSVYSIDYNTDLDLSFTSVASTTTTDKTFASTSSARSSLARSSLTLSFNERLSLSFNDRLSLSFNDRLPSTSAKPNHHHHHHLLCRPHRRWDPHWSAIRAAINMSFDGRLHLRHLKLLRHLGTGNLGRVFLCRLRDYHHSNPHAHFALKVVDKESLTPKKLAHVETEAKILSTLDHPFLPTLYAHIDVSHYTCLLIDYCSGGDLHFLLRKQPNYRLPLYAVRFYAAEVLVALEYLHAKGIVYRDLKPENILLREDGHIMLSDFDLCFTSEVTARIENFEAVVGATRRRRSNESCGCLGTERRRRRRRMRRSSNVAGPEDCVVEPTAAFSKSCVGTHEYLAPELIAGNGHSNGVDWWAFGVLIYELMHGTTPFKGINKDATLRNIASTKEAVFPRAEEMMEEEGTAEAKDLIRRLLVKDSRRRLGCARGAAEIKRHPFFDGVKWPLIRSYRPPEVRGGVVRKSKGKNQVGHHVISSGAIGFLKRRRWLWRRLTHFLKSKGSKANNVCFNNGPKLKKIGPSR